MYLLTNLSLLSIEPIIAFVFFFQKEEEEEEEDWERKSGPLSQQSCTIASKGWRKPFRKGTEMESWSYDLAKQTRAHFLSDPGRLLTVTYCIFTLVDNQLQVTLSDEDSGFNWFVIWVLLTDFDVYVFN